MQVKTRSYALVLAISLLAHRAPAQHANIEPPAQTAPTQVPLSLVAAQVVKTLDAFNAQAESRSVPKLSRVTFDFNVTGTQGVGFSFDILIFKLGANRETSTSNEVAFTYIVPAAPADPGLTPHIKPATHDFSQSLLQMLQAAGAQAQQTRTVGAARFTNLTVTLSYGAVWDASASGGGALNLIALEGSVDRKRSDVQTLFLTFGP